MVGGGGRKKNRRVGKGVGSHRRAPLAGRRAGDAYSDSTGAPRATSDDSFGIHRPGTRVGTDKQKKVQLARPDTKRGYGRSAPRPALASPPSPARPGLAAAAGGGGGVNAGTHPVGRSSPRYQRNKGLPGSSSSSHMERNSRRRVQTVGTAVSRPGYFRGRAFSCTFRCRWC